MTEFTKAKLAFAVAALAILFTISPILLQTESLSSDYLHIHISLKYLYYCFASLLATSVYLYGVQFFTEERRDFVQRCADMCYALAFLAPPYYFGMILLLDLLEFMDHNKFLGVKLRYGFTYGIVILIIVITLVFGLMLSRDIKRMEQASQDSKSQSEEIEFIRRAKGLYDAGSFELCVIECFRALETALRRVLNNSGIAIKRGSKDLIDQAVSARVLPERVAAMLHEIRKKRNAAMHGTPQVTGEAALRVIEQTNVIFGMLESVGNDENPETQQSL